jgi:putative ABC transport system permease protein
MTYLPIGPGELAIAAALVLIDSVLSFALGLGLERRLLVAAVRMVVQLFLVGFVLKGLFAAASPGLTFLAAFVMLAAATSEIVGRQERRLAGWWSWGLGGGAASIATALVAALALTTQLRADPWWDPRYLLPLMGIILGSVMNGISLSLGLLTSWVERERAAIEARLCLGEPIGVALKPAMRHAMRSGLIPIVNQMSAAGLVTLPGLMTGQILAGMDPIDAVKYQILILFLLAGGTGIGILAATYGAAWRLTDDRHRLRLDRLK